MMNLSKAIINRNIAKTLGLIVAAIGVAALLGWALDNPILKSFHPSFVSMKPNTAAAFLLCGIALFLKSAPEKRSRIADICAGAAALIGLLTLCEYVLGIDLRIDQILFREPAGATLTVIPGRMAPDTATAFLLAGLGLLCLNTKLRKTRPAEMLFLLAGLIGFASLLGYILGTASMYGYSRFTAMALPTALAFVALCIGGLTSRMESGMPSASSHKNIHDSGGRRVSFAFILVSSFMAVVIAIGGRFYCRYYARDFREELSRKICAIATLKESEIVQYRKERMADASILYRNEALSQLARRFLENPKDAEAQRRLQVWLDKYSAHYQYGLIRLVDAHGVTRLSSPAGLPPISSLISKHVSQVLQSGKIYLQDFYRNELDGRVYLSLLVPILDESDGGRPLGVLVLRIDPATYLYPYIQSWPIPSKTGETLLVRREGNDALFLNELKYKKNATLNLRISLDRKDVPAVKAVLGKTVAEEGRDYRGAPVIANTHAIKGSPWFLVTKMDLSEANAPLKEHLRLVVYFIIVLLLCVGACIGFVWRMWETRLLRERLAADAALRESELLRTAEAKYHNTLDSMLEGCQIIGFDWRYLYLNDAADKHNRRPKEELLGNRYMDMWPGIEDTEVFEAIRRCMEAREPQSMENEFEFPDGAIGCFDLRIYPVPDGIAVFSMDITGRKQAELAAREAQLRYRALFEKSPYGILLIDPVSSLPVDFNDTACRQLGYSREEFAQLRIQDYDAVEDPGETARRILRVVKCGENSFETKHRAKNGELRDVFVAVQLIKMSAGDLMVCRYQDITRRKKFEEELAHTSAELARKNKELEQVVYVASHDLRSPLVNVQGFSKELGYAMDELAGILKSEGMPPDIREKAARILEGDVPESLKYITTSISRMDALLTGLLKLSRLGRSALNIEKLNMNNIITDVVDSYEFQIKESGTKIEATDLPPCRGDATQIGQVFANLVGNALKYLDPTRPGKIAITAEKRDGRAIYCVEDNGVGIAPEHQEIVFEIFHRLNPDAGDGEGLGLTIVRTILDRLNGKIRLESEPGKGSRVFVSLPCA